jgi:hypothetical protein
MEQHRASRVSDRESDYQKRRVRTLSPERVDPFAAQTPDSSSRTFRVCPERHQHVYLFARAREMDVWGWQRVACHSCWRMHHSLRSICME